MGGIIVNQVKYSRVKLLLTVGLCCALSLFSAWVFHEWLVLETEVSGGWIILAATCLICSLFVLPLALRYLVSSTVLSWDQRGISHHGLLGKSTIKWEQLEGVSFAHGGSNATQLRLHGPFNAFGCVAIRQGFLKGGLERLAQIVSDLEACAAERANGGIPQRRTPQTKAAQSAPEPVAAQPVGFGRKGI